MNNQYNLMYAADFYKVSHKVQYPENVTHVHSTLVARGANYNEFISKDEFQWFGLSVFIRKLKSFEKWFFSLNNKEVWEILKEYKTFLDLRLGGDNNVHNWYQLWSRGENKLPITIHAIPEKIICKFQTPLMTVENTDPEFAWLTSYIETTALSNIWPVTTAANRSYHIRKLIEDKMKNHTPEERLGIDFMCHDFSYRGLEGDDAAALVGCGHLANFSGSDTIPAIRMMEEVYGEITGFSVPATEHSVMCAGGKEDELATYSRILDTYPSGIVSIVSDTWDYFKVLTETLPILKERIMSRDGKVVIRPDSGNPVEIICGSVNYFSEKTPNKYINEKKGSLRILEEIFGVTYDSCGLKLLNSHIGLIYGDGMNQEKIKEMVDRMVEIGFSPMNIVFGIGAYTYQLTTRDELGFAFKATAVKIDGEWVPIQKDPATDSGKKSLTGRFTGGNLKKVF